MTTSTNPQLNDADLELLSAYIDNQLAGAERATIEARLGREPALRAALDELRATVGVLRDLEPLKPPRSFALDPAVAAPRRAGLFARLNFGSGLAAVVLACAVLTFFVGRGIFAGRAGPSVAQAPAASQNAPQALFAPTAAPAEQPLAAEGATTAAPEAANSAAGSAEQPTAAPAPELSSAAQATAAPAGGGNVVGAELQATEQAPAAAAPAGGESTAGGAPAGDRSLAQQPTPGSTGASPGYPAPQAPAAPIATSGSTSSNTTYLPPQAPGEAPAGQAKANGAQPSPATIALAVLLILLVIGAVLGVARRRRG